MQMTKSLIDYIKKAHLQVEKLSAQTGIPAEKLIGDGKNPLTAEELIRFCSVLNVKPEEFYVRKLYHKTDKE